jgi:hypothetical protein
MSSIAAGTTTGSALVSTGDTTGELVLKTNGTTTAVTIGTDQSVSLTAGLTIAAPTVFPAGSASTPSITTTGDTNTGIYFPAADTIGFACGGTEDFRVDGDGQLWNTINSEVGTDYTTLYKGYLCRAWVNFNGTGTVAIRASGNVSSITDNNTGDYTVNFTTAMPDADYAVNATCTQIDGGTSTLSIGIRDDTFAPTTSGVRMLSQRSNGANEDVSTAGVSIFR